MVSLFAFETVHIIQYDKSICVGLMIYTIHIEGYTLSRSFYVSIDAVTPHGLPFSIPDRAEIYEGVDASTAATEDTDVDPVALVVPNSPSPVIKALKMNTK